MPTEEKYKEIIDIGMALIEEKMMIKFGMTNVDAQYIIAEYLEELW